MTFGEPKAQIYHDQANTMAIAPAIEFTKRKKILALENGYHGGLLSFPMPLDPTNTNLPHDFILAPYNDVERNPLSHWMTLGKWVGGSMTVGAFGGRKDIMSMFDLRTGALRHSGTFNNNVVTMAAGFCGLDVSDESEVERLNAMGEHLLQRIQALLVGDGMRAFKTESELDPLSPLKKELERPFEGIVPDGAAAANSVKLPSREQRNPNGITGQGSMLNIHFYGPSENIWKALFWHHMLDHGICLAQRGFMALSLELTYEHLDKSEEAARGFIVRLELLWHMFAWQILAVLLKIKTSHDSWSLPSANIVHTKKFRVLAAESPGVARGTKLRSEVEERGSTVHVHKLKRTPINLERNASGVFEEDWPGAEYSYLADLAFMRRLDAGRLRTDRLSRSFSSWVVKSPAGAIRNDLGIAVGDRLAITDSVSGRSDQAAAKFVIAGAIR
ncbi:glutamate-1-semialdehyde 2:1-aminomutase aminotransferase [Diplocarpon mali]|nr:glutamate-1-semialdehyde 2:1-aminomutase aminotransferase [Diplocarpon mali]